MLIFLPIWLIGWTIGGGAAIMQLTSVQGYEAWFLLVWLCGWLAGELFALYAFLWLAFGYEIIKLEHRNLSIKRSIFGYGPTENYETQKITNLRASGFFAPMMSWSHGMAQWGLSGCTVAFDYDTKTKRFGINLSETDANQLVSTIKSRFNLNSQ